MLLPFLYKLYVLVGNTHAICVDVANVAALWFCKQYYKTW